MDRAALSSSNAARCRRARGRGASLRLACAGRAMNEVVHLSCVCRVRMIVSAARFLGT